MPEWFCKKNCSNYEAQFDQSMASMRAQMKDIEEAFKQHKLKLSLTRFKPLTSTYHQTQL